MKNYKITDSIKIKNEEIACEGIGEYEGVRVGGYRYSLSINISKPKGNKTLACIMMNPSTTFPDVEWLIKDYKNKLNVSKKTKGFDPTVKNVIRMAYAKKYNKIIVFNIFPLIQPNGKKALEYIKEHLNDNQKENKQEIKKLLPKYQEVLIAWGSKIPKEIIKEYLELLKIKNAQLVTYKWNKKENCPYHPSQQVENRFTTDKNGEVRQKIKGKKEVGIISQFINDNSKDFIPLEINDGKLILKNEK